VDCMVLSCSPSGHTNISTLVFHRCQCGRNDFRQYKFTWNKTGESPDNYMFSINIFFVQYLQIQNYKLSFFNFWQIAREIKKTMDDMGRSAFPVRPGETFHMTVSYSACQWPEINVKISRFSYTVPQVFCYG